MPGLFPGTALVRDPGMNVAYWNLYEHDLRLDADGRFLVDDTPLKFFHFSGFDPRNPDELSRHQTRLQLSEVPTVGGLCRDYAGRVVAKATPLGETTWPFDRLADGRALGHALWRLYREGEREGAFELSPFTVDGTNEFIAWLTEGAVRALNERIVSERIGADARRCPVRQTVVALSAAIRELELSIAELSAQVSASTDATAEWLHGLGDSMLGFERRFCELETRGAPRLSDLTDRMSQTEIPLRQQVISDTNGHGDVSPVA